MIVEVGYRNAEIMVNFTVATKCCFEFFKCFVWKTQSLPKELNLIYSFKKKSIEVLQ